MKSATTVLFVSLALASAAPKPVLAQEQPPGAPTTSILTESDQRILERGPYDTTEIVVGGLLGTVVGFGSGHAAQSRYRRTGWIYTVGEVGSIGLIASATACDSSGNGFGCVYTIALSGTLLFLGFRVAEAVDVWAHPAHHNHRYRKLKERTDESEFSFSVEPILDGSAKLGFALRY